MKYKSKVIIFNEDHVVNIPDDNIIVKYIFEPTMENLFGKLPSIEKMIVLVPLKEE